jgi:hypothetical protein
MQTLLGQIKLRELEERLDELIGMYGLQLRYDEERQFRARIAVHENDYSFIELHADLKDKKYLLTRIILKAHELGHYLSYSVFFQENYTMWVIDKTIDEKEEEMRAWEFAYQVLSDLEFDYWDQFEQYGKWALSTYYKVYHNPKEGVHHAVVTEFFDSLLANVTA